MHLLILKEVKHFKGDTYTAFFFHETAKSRSSYADVQAQMDICCSHVRSDSSTLHFFFLPKDSKVKIRLRGCAGSYVYWMFSWA